MANAYVLQRPYALICSAIECQFAQWPPVANIVPVLPTLHPMSGKFQCSAANDDHLAQELERIYGTQIWQRQQAGSQSARCMLAKIGYESLCSLGKG